MLSQYSTATSAPLSSSIWARRIKAPFLAGVHAQRHLAEHPRALDPNVRKYTPTPVDICLILEAAPRQRKQTDTSCKETNLHIPMGIREAERQQELDDELNSYPNEKDQARNDRNHEGVFGR